MTEASLRLPAEWERQRATILAWPTASSDWSDQLDAIRGEYLTLIKAIAEFQTAVVLIHPADRAALNDALTHPNVTLITMAFDDTWCRDYGPISLVSSGRGLALDFRFNAWGGKYAASNDDQVAAELALHPLMAGFDSQRVDFELEGGAIESNGAGQILINWHCLKKRHPKLSQGEISDRLKQALELDDVLGIDCPALEGDDTDGHIDTLARFINPTTIAYQTMSNADQNQRLVEQLERLRQGNGKPYQLTALPAVQGFDPHLPANYANFLLVNGACLYPSYGVESDQAAHHALAHAFPERRVIPVPARTMMSQFGGPHCATMHIPDPDR